MEGREQGGIEMANTGSEQAKGASRVKGSTAAGKRRAARKVSARKSARRAARF